MAKGCDRGALREKWTHLSEVINLQDKFVN